jgi:hypothetical protein
MKKLLVEGGQRSFFMDEIFARGNIYEVFAMAFSCL